MSSQKCRVVQSLRQRRQLLVLEGFQVGGKVAAAGGELAAERGHGPAVEAGAAEGEGGAGQRGGRGGRGGGRSGRRGRRGGLPGGPAHGVAENLPHEGGQLLRCGGVSDGPALPPVHTEDERVVDEPLVNILPGAFFFGVLHQLAEQEPHIRRVFV